MCQRHDHALVMNMISIWIIRLIGIEVSINT